MHKEERDASAPIDPPRAAASVTDPKPRPRPKRQRPYGRSLSDFCSPDTLEGLFPAEKKLLEACRKGEECALESGSHQEWRRFQEWLRTPGNAQVAADAVSAALSGDEHEVLQLAAQFPAPILVVMNKIGEQATALAFAEGLHIPLPHEQQDALKHIIHTAVEWVRLASEQDYWPGQAERDPELFHLAVKAVAVESPSSSYVSAIAAMPKQFQDVIEEFRFFARRHVLRLRTELSDRHTKDPSRSDFELSVELLADLRTAFNDTLSVMRIENWRAVEHDDENVKIRADFLRFLAMGGDEHAPIHELGVRLVGANVLGVLNCSEAQIMHPLSIKGCHFAEGVYLTGSVSKSISLESCRVAALDATRISCKGDLQLGRGFRCTGWVALDGAKIEGDLNFSGAQLRAPSWISCALSFDAAVIRGSCLLTQQFGAPFYSVGTIAANGAWIGGRFDAAGAQVESQTWSVMSDNLRTGGDVRLCEGFFAQGEVRLVGAHIKGDLALIGGTFDNSRVLIDDEEHDSLRSQVAIELYGARIDGTLWLGPASESKTQSIIRGSLGLSGVKAAKLVLHPSFWPPELVEARRDAAITLHKDAQSIKSKMACTVALDGFRFEHLTVGRMPDYMVSPLEAIMQLLARQPSAHLGRSLRSQPFEHAAALFRRMGHDDEAREIAKAKSAAKRRQARLLAWDRLLASLKPRRSPRWLVPIALLSWPLTAPIAIAAFAVQALIRGVQWLAMDWFLGAGYDRTKVAAAFVMIWATGAILYDQAARQEAFVPSDKGFVENQDNRKLCAGRSVTDPTPIAMSIRVPWVACPQRPDGYTPFHAAIYSADLMLPFAPLNQRRDWRVNEQQTVTIALPYMSTLSLPASAIEWATVLQAALAVGLYTILLAFLTGAIKKE